MKTIAIVEKANKQPLSYSFSSDGVFSIYQSNKCLFSLIAHIVLKMIIDSIDVHVVVLPSANRQTVTSEYYHDAIFLRIKPMFCFTSPIMRLWYSVFLLHTPRD